jgi:hypothetical protein
LRQDTGGEEVEVGNATRRHATNPRHDLAEQQQPQHWLARAGEQLRIMIELLHLGRRHRPGLSQIVADLLAN